MMKSRKLLKPSKLQFRTICVKKMQLEINPLREIFSQQDKIKELITKRSFVPEIPNIEHTTNPNLASEFHKRIAQWIQEFDANLDQEHEVGVKFSQFWTNYCVSSSRYGILEPFSDFISRVLLMKMNPFELIQHVSQISVLIMKVKRIDTSKPKRQIGFTPWEDE